MRHLKIWFAVAFSAALMPRVAAAQHDAHQPGAAADSAEMAPCAQVQPVVDNIIAAATARLELARQSNSPSEMRAATDHLESALRDIRTQLAPCSAAAGTADSHSGHEMPGDEAAAIDTWLKGYDAAFNAKDLEKLAVFYHPDVTIYEGGGINNGWVDYRDHHLGPELKAFENLQFAHSDTKVTVLPGGQSAYATSEYSIKARMGEREIDSRGLETLVLLKGADGSWKIRHSHTSSRPARRPAA